MWIHETFEQTDRQTDKANRYLGFLIRNCHQIRNRKYGSPIFGGLPQKTENGGFWGEWSSWRRVVLAVREKPRHGGNPIGRGL